MPKSTKHKINPSCLKQLPAGTPALPEGWLSAYDAMVLYTAAGNVIDGESILEVGSWIGRSSCCLAYGVRDAAPSRQIRYDIVDYGIAGAAEWSDKFGTSVFIENEAEHFSKVILHPGGTGALLKQNLVDRGLSRHVSLIILGDIRDVETTRRYSLVFCDATHGEEEIRKNIPIISRLMPFDSVLICDDIISDFDAEIVADLWGSDVHHLTCETGEYSKMGIFTRGTMNNIFMGDA